MMDIDIVGNPVLKTREELLKKRSDEGLYVYGCQMLQNPLADVTMGFKIDWLQFYNSLKNYDGWNFYILVDPAGEKKRTNDYTVIVVIGLAPDGNYYLVDGIRDRLNLTERTKTLFSMVRKWKPKRIGYEKYGKDSDIEHIEYVQEQEGYRFNIEPLGGSMAKSDRIRRLVPIFEQGRFYLPHSLIFVTSEGKGADFIKLLIDEEYTSFPVSAHDDMMDCISRIVEEDLQAVFPLTVESLAFGIPRVDQEYDPFARLMSHSNTGKSNTNNNWRELLTR
jgi:predicted phage terminase large subunit-like protein